MQRKDAEREEARRLRAEGLSIKKIAARLGVAVSSVSVWTRDVERPAPPSEAPASGPLDLEPTKRCGRCRAELPLSAFNRAGDGRQHWCRECFRAYFVERGDRHRQQVRTTLQTRRRAAQQHVRTHLAASACVDCGEDELLVLEFDHHRGEKTADISRLVAQGAAIPRLVAELERCEVVCRNCHRRRTARRAGWFRLTGVFPEAWPASRRRNHQYVLDVLRRSSCIECGETDALVLEFDHVGDKRAAVSKLVARCSLDTLRREIAQCEVRCCNCHVLRTVARAGGTWRDDAGWVL